MKSIEGPKKGSSLRSLGPIVDKLAKFANALGKLTFAKSQSTSQSQSGGWELKIEESSATLLYPSDLGGGGLGPYTVMFFANGAEAYALVNMGALQSDTTGLSDPVNTL